MIPTRVPAATTALIALVLAPLAGAFVIQDLVDLAPENSYLVVHGSKDPGMAFVDEYMADVVDAVRDAGFDEFVMEMLQGAGAPQATVQEVRAVSDLISHLASQVDWAALFENEVLYAQRMHPAIQGAFMMPSYLLASRVDSAKVAGVAASLVHLMETVASLADEISVRKTVTGGEAPSHRYKLMIKTKQGPMAITQLAVHDDTIVMGLGEEYFNDSVKLLEGRGGQAITASPRFQRAMADLPESGQLTYFDCQNMVADMRGQLPAMHGWGVPPAVPAMLDDMLDLVSVVESTASKAHGRDYSVVTETMVRFDAEQAAQGHPVFAMLAGNEASPELMDYVPANALAFRVSGGTDLRPLYRWFEDRVRDYAPEPDEFFMALEAGEAILGLDIEDNLLSWIGSESVTIQMPAEDPSPMHPSEMVYVARLRDPDSAREVVDRMAKTFNAIVPRVLERAKKEVGAFPFWPEVRLEDDGAYPGLRRMVVKIGEMPLPEAQFGVMGRNLIYTTSEEALTHVLGVVAGENDGIWEHPDLRGLGLMPEGPVTSFSRVNHHHDLAGVIEGMKQFQGMVSMALGAAAQKDPALRPMVQSISGFVPRITRVLESLDFLEDTVSYTQVREEGLARYVHATTRYVPPHERHGVLVRER